VIDPTKIIRVGVWCGMAIFSGWAGKQAILVKSDTPLSVALFALSVIFLMIAFRE
jgi:hypothetical protein